MKIKKRIFIVGCPRSGTTLLQSLLAAHPLICSFPETHFFPNTVGSSWRKYLKLASPVAHQKLYAFLDKIGQKDMQNFVPVHGLLLKNYVTAFVKILDELTSVYYTRKLKTWIKKISLLVRPEETGGWVDALMLGVWQ